MSDYKQAFFVVPQRIIDLPGLTLAFLKIYETIFQFWNHGKSCYLKNQVIMERTGITSESTIREAFIFFENAGELIRKYKNGSRYLVQPEGIIEYDESAQSDAQPVAKSTPPRRQSDAPPVAKSTPHLNKKNINTKNINKSICASDDAHASFESFWNLYPRKKDKMRSLKIWLTSNCHEKRSIIMNKLTDQINYDVQWKSKQFIPHPTTYLRNERWEDEITLKSESKTPIQNIMNECMEAAKRTIQ